MTMTNAYLGFNKINPNTLFFNFKQKFSSDFTLSINIKNLWFWPVDHVGDILFWQKSIKFGPFVVLGRLVLYRLFF